MFFGFSFSDHVEDWQLSDFIVVFSSSDIDIGFIFYIYL